MMFFLSDEMPFSFDELLLFGAASGGKLVEDTATGNPLVFLTDLARPLKSLLIPFTPIQQGTGDPSPTNVRDIVPWEGLRLVHLDENLLSINRNSAQTSNGITFTPIKQDNKTVAIHVEGVCSANTFFNLNYVNGTTLSIPKGKCLISGYTDNVGLRVFYRDSNGTERVAYNSTTASTALCTIPDDAVASWIRLQIEAGENYINENVYPIIHAVDSTVTETDISFPSPVYGGTLDAVTGVLTVGWARLQISDLDWQYQENWSGRFRAGLAGKDGVDASVSANLMCDCYKSALGTNSNDNIICGYGKGNSGIVYIKDSRFTDKDDFVEAVGDYYIYYPLLTPQEIQLTQAQITALVGNNTIWSDADGEMTAVYFKKA